MDEDFENTVEYGYLGLFLLLIFFYSSDRERDRYGVSEILCGFALHQKPQRLRSGKPGPPLGGLCNGGGLPMKEFSNSCLGLELMLFV